MECVLEKCFGKERILGQIEKLTLTNKLKNSIDRYKSDKSEANKLAMYNDLLFSEYDYDISKIALEKGVLTHIYNQNHRNSNINQLTRNHFFSKYLSNEEITDEVLIELSILIEKSSHEESKLEESEYILKKLLTKNFNNKKEVIFNLFKAYTTCIYSNERRYSRSESLINDTSRKLIKESISIIIKEKYIHEQYKYITKVINDLNNLKLSNELIIKTLNNMNENLIYQQSNTFGQRYDTESTFPLYRYIRQNTLMSLLPTKDTFFNILLNKEENKKELMSVITLLNYISNKLRGGFDKEIIENMNLYTDSIFIQYENMSLDYETLNNNEKAQVDILSEIINNNDIKSHYSEDYIKKIFREKPVNKSYEQPELIKYEDIKEQFILLFTRTYINKERLPEFILNRDNIDYKYSYANRITKVAQYYFTTLDNSYLLNLTDGLEYTKETKKIIVNEITKSSGKMPLFIAFYNKHKLKLREDKDFMHELNNLLMNKTKGGYQVSLHKEERLKYKVVKKHIKDFLKTIYENDNIIENFFKTVDNKKFLFSVTDNIEQILYACSTKKDYEDYFENMINIKFKVKKIDRYSCLLYKQLTDFNKNYSNSKNTNIYDLYAKTINEHSESNIIVAKLVEEYYERDYINENDKEMLDIIFEKLSLLNNKYQYLYEKTDIYKEKLRENEENSYKKTLIGLL